MGYTIQASGKNGEPIATFEAPAGFFDVLRDMGYNWFGLLDAWEHDGGVSGTGKEKGISHDELVITHMPLKKYWDNGLLKLNLLECKNNCTTQEEVSLDAPDFNEVINKKHLEALYSTTIDLVPVLLEFMEICIDYSWNHERMDITLFFG